MNNRDPINATDDEARAQAKAILRRTRFGALAVTHPETGLPYVARVALIWTDDALHGLISTLSTHTQALHADPNCAVLVGEPASKGDPLTHPRMTISAEASQTAKKPLREAWLAAIPKAQLYFEFTDFQMWRFAPVQIDLNGGFGKAYKLTPSDLVL